MSRPLSDAVRQAIEAGPIAHVVTLDPDGTPHVSMAWIGLEDDEVVIGTLPDQRKLRNLRRDGRVAISFTTGRKTPYGLDEYIVLRGRARVTEGGAAALLQRLAYTYIGPGTVFPPMPNPPPGFVTRISVDEVSGLGPWTADG